MSDTDDAEPPRRRRAARTKSSSAPSPQDAGTQSSDEEGARDEQRPATAKKGAAGPDRDAETDPRPGDDETNDEGAGTSQETMSAEGDEGGSEEDEPGVSAAEEAPGRVSLSLVAQRAAEHVASLTGRCPESVISIEPRDDDWCVGVEAVETRRIPDSADILAVYEVVVRSSGDLISYRRIRRYARGQVDRPRR